MIETTRGVKDRSWFAVGEVPRGATEKEGRFREGACLRDRARWERGAVSFAPFLPSPPHLFR